MLAPVRDKPAAREVSYPSPLRGGIGRPARPFLRNAEAELRLWRVKRASGWGYKKKNGPHPTVASRIADAKHRRSLVQGRRPKVAYAPSPRFAGEGSRDDESRASDVTGW